MMEKSPAPKKKLVAEVKPRQQQQKQLQQQQEELEDSRRRALEEENRLKKEKVKKAAERFEQQAAAAAAAEQDSSALPSSSSSQPLGALSAATRARSKSIGSNLYQKLLELEEDKGRIAESLVQSKSILPWREQEGAGASAAGASGVRATTPGKAPPVIRKRDSAWRRDIAAEAEEDEEDDHRRLRQYALRMSKSSDSITAAKMLAEARLQQQREDELAASRGQANR